MSSKKNKRPPVAAAIVQPKPGNVVADHEGKNNELSLLLKEETLRWIFSIFCALFVYLCAAWVIQKA
jgi:hypothetical protein